MRYCCAAFFLLLSKNLKQIFHIPYIYTTKNLKDILPGRIMHTITRQEELIMLSIVKLGDEAYLIAIQEFLSEVTGKKIGLTSIHLPLSRLEKKGLLKSIFGEATAVRGGRRKKIYSVTKLGYEALDEHKQVSDRLWSSYSGPALGGSD